MDDLISREQAIKEAYPICIDGDVFEVVQVETLIGIPSIDAVPVIRCKDCKYWYREIHNGIEYFNFSSCDLNHHGDGCNFYCADGERREK